LGRGAGQDGKITRETRFYITSLVLLAHAIGPMIHDHWAVELEAFTRFPWELSISATKPQMRLIVS